VSVVQIGSTTSTERRDPLPLMTMSTESLSVDAGSSVTLGRSSPSTGHLRAHVAGTVDPAGCTPIKSSLKKVSPVHAKSKSVSFSAAGSAADDDDDDVDDDATTGERAARDSPVVRVHDRARPDGGIGPRRALVSDSGVFCDADDEVAVVDDSKPTTASPPSRRTTVSVSCGMAAVNSASPRRHNSAELTAASQTGSPAGSRARDAAAGSPGSSRPSQQASAPAKCSAAITVTDKKRPSTKNATTPEVRHKTPDATQVTAAVTVLTSHTLDGICLLIRREAPLSQRNRATLHVR